MIVMICRIQSVDVARCDDIYEAIRFNESQECYQDQQPASDWDAVSDDLMNKIQIKLLTSPSSCLMLVSCLYIKHHPHFEHAKAFMPSHIPFSIVFASHQRSLLLPNIHKILVDERPWRQLMDDMLFSPKSRHCSNIQYYEDCPDCAGYEQAHVNNNIALYRSHQWSFVQIFNVYMENLSFHSILLPP